MAAPVEVPLGSDPVTHARSGTAGLGAAAARGVRWVTLQSLGVKVVTLLGQILLGWYLLPEDFGVIGLATTVTMYAALVERAGIREVLIQRGRNIDRWTRIGVPFALSLGLSETLLVLALAPVAARAYGEPQLLAVLGVLSLQGLPRAAAIPAEAKLLRQMRFREVAVSQWGVAVFTTVLMVLLAWWGWGAMSFALPRPIAMTWRAAWLWWAARPAFEWRRLHVRRWPLLAGDSALLLAGNLMITFTQQGDYMLLGLYHPSEVVGRYFFAFALSMQTLQVIMPNLSAVFFPALARLQKEPRRQADAFLRTSSLLAAVVMPVGALQAAFAGPMVRLIFPQRWEPTIPIFVILSCALGFAAVGISAGSLLVGQGRFKTMLWTNALYFALFIAMVWPASAWGGGVAVAWSVLAFWVFVGLFHPWVACRSAGIGGGAVLRSVLNPMLITATAFAPLAVTMLLFDTLPIWIVLPAGLTSSVIYILLLYRLQRPLVMNMLALLRQIRRPAL